MKKEDPHCSRRDFFRITGAAGIGSILGSMENTARASDPDDMTQHLYTSLERMKTNSIDLFFMHVVSDVKNKVNRQNIKSWAERAKAEGKIRFFGFRTHKNMEQCLMDGARLGWIDGIMASYNYRLMHTAAMKKAADACIQAGIGLTAMKTQAIQKFNKIPAIDRRRLATMDYSKAENICPQNIPIARFMQHAVETLADNRQG